MNPAQNRKYFQEWGALRKALRERGFSSADCEAFRQKLTIRAVGFAKSHMDFTNDEFTEWRKKCAAARTPDGFAEQMALQDAETIGRAVVERRIEAALDVLVEPKGDRTFHGLHRNNYLSAVCRRVNDGKATHECDHRERCKLMGALEARARAKKYRAAEAAAAATEQADGNPF